MVSAMLSMQLESTAFGTSNFLDTPTALQMHVGPLRTRTYTDIRTVSSEVMEQAQYKRSFLAGHTHIPKGVNDAVQMDQAVINLSNGQHADNTSVLRLELLLALP